MHNRKLKSALMVAGVAAGAAAAAATWLGKKRNPNLRAVGAAPSELGELEGAQERPGLSSGRYSEIRDLSPADTSPASMLEPESVELPSARSANSDGDWAPFSRRDRSGQDDITSSALLAEPAPRGRRSDFDLALDDVWSSTPGIAEPEQAEGYDAVLPEDLGAVWIARATQATPEHRPPASDPFGYPQLEDLVSQSSYLSSRSPDEDEDFTIEVEEDEDVIADDDLDEPKNERG